MKTQKDRWNENCDEVIEQLEENINAIAARQTGRDPLAYLQYLNDVNLLPRHIDPVLIVIPVTWGEAN